MIQFAGDVDSGTNVSMGMVHGKIQLEERRRQAALQTRSLDEREREDIQRRRTRSSERFNEASKEAETRVDAASELQAKLARRRAASEGLLESNESTHGSSASAIGPRGSTHGNSAVLASGSQRTRSVPRLPKKAEAMEERSGATNELHAVLARRRAASGETDATSCDGSALKIGAKDSKAPTLETGDKVKHGATATAPQSSTEVKRGTAVSTSCPVGADALLALSSASGTASASDVVAPPRPVSPLMVEFELLDMESSEKPAQVSTEDCGARPSGIVVSAAAPQSCKQDCGAGPSGVVVSAVASPCRGRGQRVETLEVEAPTGGPPLPPKPALEPASQNDAEFHIPTVSTSRLDACEVQPEPPEEPQLELEPAAAVGGCQPKCCVIS